MQRSLSLVLIIVSLVTLFGCNKISGTVKEDGVSLKGVNVTLVGPSHMMDVTDNMGDYLFFDCAPGPYTVIPSKAGYTFIPQMRTVMIHLLSNESYAGYDFEAKRICEEQIWEGDHVITNAEELNALSGYTTITGTLTIENSDLTDLHGLQCLKEAGQLIIQNNDSLRNVTALGSLERTGSLVIDSNTTLTSLNFDSLYEVANEFIITNNISLCSEFATALVEEGCGEIGGPILIEGNNDCS